VLALPGEMKKFMARAGRGELEMKFRNLDENVRVIYTMGHQLIYTLVGLTGAVFWLVLHRTEPHFAKIAAYVSGGCGVLLLGSIWATRNRLRKKRR
jgi:hypothetical protein